MESLIKLFYDLEIQLLVLLSFGIQIFLFFTGSLRRCNSNILIRLTIWVAYLGADMVAICALGYLARQEDAPTGHDTLGGTHPLAFFWAPFLLVHLGGQDTITAFSIEDNNLWLRHLLNLVMQVVLAIYVFWKQIGRLNVELIASGILVFVTGIIKYGERTWSLRCGSFDSLETSDGNHHEHRLPEVIDEDTSYSNTVSIGMHSMPHVVSIFAGRSYFQKKNIVSDLVNDRKGQGLDRVLKVLDVELGLMYDDLYTKAPVLRTRSGIILRCISQISIVAAFMLFLASDRQSYRRADIGITYSLFIGVFFLEFFAVIILMASPWAWAWLKVRNYDRLAWFSWFLLSSNLIGWPEKRPLWCNAMGQYNFSDWLWGSDQYQPRSFNQQPMTAVRRLATLVGIEKKKIFWVSKLLDIEYIKADRMLKYLLEGVGCVRNPKEWPNIGPYLREILFMHANNFGALITLMHVATELHLSKYPCSGVEENASSDTNVLVEDCRELSYYMMYLLVTHPSLLPLDHSEINTLEECQEELRASEEEGEDVRGQFTNLFDPHACMETLKEIKEMWLLLIIYAASKSRPEIHAAQQAKGGELLTFVYLLLAHHGFRSSSGYSRIELHNFRFGHSIFYALRPSDGELMDTPA